jgi:hypothetical protein
MMLARSLTSERAGFSKQINMGIRYKFGDCSPAKIIFSFGSITRKKSAKLWPQERSLEGSAKE